MPPVSCTSGGVESDWAPCRVHGSAPGLTYADVSSSGGWHSGGKNVAVLLELLRLPRQLPVTQVCPPLIVDGKKVYLSFIILALLKVVCINAVSPS